MLEFRNEKFDDALIEELKPLTVRHYEEVALHKGDVPLDPDWNKYKRLVELGFVMFVGARNNGKLVGYSLFIMADMIHYRTTRLADNDVLYLSPEYRQGMAGVKMIKFCEAELKQQGIKKILWHVKQARDFRKILYRMGYVDEDMILSKILKD
jgi:GNAT superfamily N-acetyltransferase